MTEPGLGIAFGLLLMSLGIILLILAWSVLRWTS